MTNARSQYLRERYTEAINNMQDVSLLVDNFILAGWVGSLPATIVELRLAFIGAVEELAVLGLGELAIEKLYKLTAQYSLLPNFVEQPRLHKLVYLSKTAKTSQDAALVIEFMQLSSGMVTTSGQISLELMEYADQLAQNKLRPDENDTSRLFKAIIFEAVAKQPAKVRTSIQKEIEKMVKRAIKDPKITV